MAIERVRFESDHYLFGKDFALDFCPGVNVLIGGNGTGKTTLLKSIYFWFHKGMGRELWQGGAISSFSMPRVFDSLEDDTVVYIPEKDILEHAPGLLPFIEQKQTGFSEIYRSVLLAAQDVPTREQSDTQKYVVGKLSEIIGGHVHRESADGSFYTLKTDGRRVPFSMEASGFKRLGFLQLLVSFGLLNPGAVLFWDEPENSLNPEIIPDLVDILLRLSRSGVQIFLATHNELFASYFAVNRNKDDKLLFVSLYRDGGVIKANTNKGRFDLLEPNSLTSAPVMLYERELERGLGSDD